MFSLSFTFEIDVHFISHYKITWVYRPKIPKSHGIKWLPLYANGRRLTQNNERFIVDFSGYNEKTQKYLSILTINPLKFSDEGLYMCKSNQYQSNPHLFNLTITRKSKKTFVFFSSHFLFSFLASLKIFPKDGFLELDTYHRSINLSCTVHDHPSNTIDSLRLKWYHNNHEIAHTNLKKRFSSQQNHATLILSLHDFFVNNSDLFKCIYDNGKVSKDVRIVYTSSGK